METARRLFCCTFIVALTVSTAFAARDRNRDVPLRNWTVPGQGDHRPPEAIVPVPDAFGNGNIVPLATVPSNDSSFVTVVPCRVVDTRNATGAFGGPIFSSGQTRTYNIPAGPCAGIPANASAYSLNFSVTGTVAQGYLTAWPAGSTQPVVATMTWFGANQTLSNAAIVPAGTSDSISVFAAQSTHVIIDINGYFPEQKGQLITQLLGNQSSAPNAFTGYDNIITNYVPNVDARAFVFARCSYDGSAAGQVLAFRVAMRSPTGTGAVTIGNSFYLGVHTPAANLSVMDVNTDFLDLTAGQSYDFGVNFFQATPSGGTQLDYCTETVMIMRR